MAGLYWRPTRQGIASQRLIETMVGGARGLLKLLKRLVAECRMEPHAIVVWCKSVAWPVRPPRESRTSGPSSSQMLTQRQPLALITRPDPLPVNLLRRAQ